MMKKNLSLPMLLAITFFSFAPAYSYAENSIVLYPGQSQSIGNTTIVCARGGGGEPRNPIGSIHTWKCECHFHGTYHGDTYRHTIYFEHTLEGYLRKANEVCREDISERNPSRHYMKAENCREVRYSYSN